MGPRPPSSGPLKAGTGPPLARAAVPVRTCDIGGWTDTWFGGPGRVVNLAVSPGVRVELRPARGTSGSRRDRLVQAVMDQYGIGGQVDVEISSGVPAGSALGTSSALVVALVGAVLAIRGENPSADAVAQAAHRVETEVLGEECGLQDQVAAAHGGISYIAVDRYPDAEVETLPEWPELGGLLSTVYLGKPHASSQMHRDVIDHGDRGVLEAMRAAAVAARSAVIDRDVRAFAAAMRANDGAQRDLHPGVVGREAAAAIDLARSCGALAWKVNGAGGHGGSLAVLHESPEERAVFEDRVRTSGTWRVLPVKMTSDGLVVEVSPPRS